MKTSFFLIIILASALSPPEKVKVLKHKGTNIAIFSKSFNPLGYTANNRFTPTTTEVIGSESILKECIKHSLEHNYISKELNVFTRQYFGFVREQHRFLHVFLFIHSIFESGNFPRKPLWWQKYPLDINDGGCVIRHIEIDLKGKSCKIYCNGEA